MAVGTQPHRRSGIPLTLGVLVLFFDGLGALIPRRSTEIEQTSAPATTDQVPA